MYRGSEICEKCGLDFPKILVFPLIFPRQRFWKLQKAAIIPRSVQNHQLPGPKKIPDGGLISAKLVILSFGGA